jgi:hypothetical protein
MAYFAGLDVSVKETSVCIVDDAGKIVREVRVASEPEALLQVLTNTIYRFKRVGDAADPSQAASVEDDPLQTSRSWVIATSPCPNPPRLRAYCPELPKGLSPFSPALASQASCAVR